MATFSGSLEVLLTALEQVAENMRQEADAESEEVARSGVFSCTVLYKRLYDVEVNKKEDLHVSIMFLYVMTWI